jgi:hypothetical protein
MKRFGSIVLAVIAVLAAGCTSRSQTDSSTNQQGAVPNQTVEVPADANWQELAFFPNGNLVSQPVPLRVAVVGAEIGKSTPFPGTPLRNTIIVDVAIDNQTDSPAARPNFTITDPQGNEYPFYTGNFAGPQNIDEIDTIAAGSRVTGALYLDLFSLNQGPPASLEGWKVNAVSSGVAPTSEIKGSWDLK